MKDDCKIVVRPRGGLCNRMYVIAATHTLARRVNKKAKIVWVIDWRLGTRYEDLFQPLEGLSLDTYFWKGAEQKGSMLERACAAYYSTTVFNTTKLSQHTSRLSILANLPYYSEIRWRLLRWTKQQLRRAEFDVIIESGQTRSGLAESEIENVRRSKKTLMITNHEFIEPDIEYGTFFRLQPELRKLVDTATQDITNETIGVHIRRTDHGRAIQKSPEEAFRHAMRKEINQNPDVTFFLATDSAETKQSFQREFGDRILSNDVPLTRRSTSGLQGAIIDLYGLARTRKVLGSQVSTFSGMAAKIGGIPLVRISQEDTLSLQR